MGFLPNQPRVRHSAEFSEFESSVAPPGFRPNSLRDKTAQEKTEGYNASIAAESAFKEFAESEGSCWKARQSELDAYNFAHHVHRFSQGSRKNSIDDVLRRDYLHARL